MAWHIPGMGESKPYCGDDKFKSVRCPTKKEGHDVKVIKRGCRKSACPTCWTDYVNREAGKATDKLFELRELYRLAGHDLRHPVHFVVSPPAKDYDRPEPELREQARSIAKRAGVVGGCIVFHPYRFKGRDTVEHRAFKFPLKRSQENFRAGFGQDPKYEPHYHIIGFMPDYDIDRPFRGLKSSDLQAATGWIYKNIGRTTRKGLPMNVYGKIQYELTHVGIKPNSRQGCTLTWFGIASGNSLKVTTVKTEEDAICSVCGTQMHLYQEDEDHGPHSYHRITRHYHLRPEALARNEDRLAKWLGPKILGLKPDELGAKYQARKNEDTRNKARARRAMHELQRDFDELDDDE